MGHLGIWANAPDSLRYDYDFHYDFVNDIEFSSLMKLPIITGKLLEVAGP